MEFYPKRRRDFSIIKPDIPTPAVGPASVLPRGHEAGIMCVARGAICSVGIRMVACLGLVVAVNLRLRGRVYMAIGLCVTYLADF